MESFIFPLILLFPCRVTATSGSLGGHRGLFSSFSILSLPCFFAVVLYDARYIKVDPRGVFTRHCITPKAFSLFMFEGMVPGGSIR